VRPTLLDIGGVPLPSYAVFLVLAFVAAGTVRRAEVARLGHRRMPGYRWVLVGALLGAAIGAKLGMLLFTDGLSDLLAAALSADFTGKTVVGGLVGGYVGVEVAKRAVGIRRSTGDGFAIAVPLGQAVGRLGCLLHGCCYGTAWTGPWAIELHGAPRHPTQVYELGLDLLLAGWLWLQRGRALPEGHLFRRYLVGYALIRIVLEPLRGDAGHVLGPFSAVQLVCLCVAVGFGWAIWWGERR